MAAETKRQNFNVTPEQEAAVRELLNQKTTELKATPPKPAVVSVPPPAPVVSIPVPTVAAPTPKPVTSLPVDDLGNRVLAARLELSGGRKLVGLLGNVALGDVRRTQEFLTVSVWEGGTWQPHGLVWEASPEVVKRQVLPLDLSRVTGDTIHLRLESIPSFWLLDQVAFDFSPERSFTTTEVAAASGRDGHGHDVRDPLAAVDHRFLTLEPGDFSELRFSVPDVPAGRARTHLVRSTGWYRLHTGEAAEPDVTLLTRTVKEPLGFAQLSVAMMNDALAAMRLAAR